MKMESSVYCTVDYTHISWTALRYCIMRHVHMNYFFISWCAGKFSPGLKNNQIYKTPLLKREWDLGARLF